jgi:hypothetical protein
MEDETSLWVSIGSNSRDGILSIQGNRITDSATACLVIDINVKRTDILSLSFFMFSVMAVCSLLFHSGTAAFVDIVALLRVVTCVCRLVREFARALNDFAGLERMMAAVLNAMELAGVMVGRMSLSRSTTSTIRIK